MGNKLNALMKLIVLATCIAQTAIIIINVILLNTPSGLINLIEIIFPILEFLAALKFKTKLDDDINIDSFVLKIFNVNTIMLMYIVYNILGFIFYIMLSFIMFDVITIENEILQRIFGTDPKDTNSYIIYFLRIMLYTIGLISSIFVRHVYRKSLDIYQGFS